MNEKEKQLETFIAKHVSQIESLQTDANQAYWDASTTGKAEYYENLSRLQHAIRTIYGRTNEFEFIKGLKESGQIRDARLRRQLDQLYLFYLQNQFQPELLKELVDLDTHIQKINNTFRGEMEGKKVTNSEIYSIMTTETDSRKREAAWRASKQVGEVIANDLIRLVKLRNQAAQQLGFSDYHSLSIMVGEQKVKELDQIFHELDVYTREPFIRLKEELDHILAEQFEISPAELKPWHYHDPFFQRTPLVYELDLDEYYNPVDVKAIAEQFFAGVGLPVDDILAKSDLYDREGKFPHAFSHDMNRRGDVRILCNLNNDERWMETILHELGHALYSKYHDRDEPYLFREPAHSFTTEAVAMFFGRLSRTEAWMQPMLKLSDEQREKIERVAWKYTQFQQLLFARWAMVMYYFEKQLYANPDQDLNSLWWDMVETYQQVKRPPGSLAGHWAAKFHFTIAPCYYHNYMLGELLASQLHHHIEEQVLKLESDQEVSFVGQKQVGEFLRETIFAPGARFHWNEMIMRATGEPLTTKYFIRQFVK
jgi:peptidyl-dipeptidase A